ncbi:MAG: UDP-glucose 6-dehydrogenase [Candidatus Moranbacteria bacterium RIFCSPHIGHO2_02_FULL_40_12b]|nr:MAG: UDP-glucose 6-dehydrogenase [Candidatus Moranbacteria bacterium RIFCSPHIGHO2_02_FULL_40_12b]
MNICVIGTGYVGLITGACFAEFGVNVVCIDKDEKKISQLKKGIVPFYEPGAEELLQRNLKANRIIFTTNVADAVKNSLVIFIAVGTPPRGDGSADMSYVEEVAKEIGKHSDGYKVVVTKSTVPVGTGERIKQIISKNLKSKVKFDVVSNPEFLREGSAVEDFMRPNRVVIGAENKQAIAILKDLYRPLYLIETPFVITNVKTAELIKYASNAFLAVKISYINEIANLCEALGVDVQVVAKAMGLDQRIGPKFLHAGPGYGGSCFPKDTNALAKISRGNNILLNLVEAAIKTNRNQKQRMVDKIMAGTKGVRGKTIAILGLSFKPNTNDIRESPAMEIAQDYLSFKLGAKIRAYDPEAMQDARKVMPKAIYCKDAYDAVKGADALVIATEWNQFRNLDLARLKKLMKGKFFFDLRNIYDPKKAREAGFEYYSTGRV